MKNETDLLQPADWSVEFIFTEDGGMQSQEFTPMIPHYP